MYLWCVTACQHEERTTWQQELNVFEDLNLSRDYRIANLQIDLWKAENDVNYECLPHINKASQLRIRVTEPPEKQTQPWYHQLAEATADPNKTPLNENEKQVAKNKTLCTNAAEPEDAKATFGIRYATVQQTGRMCMSLKRYIRRENANRYDTVQERCGIGDEMV